MQLDAQTSLHTAEQHGRERRAVAESDRLARTSRHPVARAAGARRWVKARLGRARLARDRSPHRSGPSDLTEAV